MRQSKRLLPVCQQDLINSFVVCVINLHKTKILIASNGLYFTHLFNPAFKLTEMAIPMLDKFVAFMLSANGGWFLDASQLPIDRESND